MQDRFKFRVWSNKHKIFIGDNNYPIGSDYQLILNQDGELIELGLGDYQDNSDDTHSWATYEKYDNCVIQFCTGLKDKNGKLIYEGDIIKASHILPTVLIEKYEFEDDKFILEYRDSFYSFIFKDVDSNEYYDIKYFAKFITNEEVDKGEFNEYTNVEVIGNIYENPELLEQKND